MDERPAKRPKRTTSAAMWDDKEVNADSRPNSSGRDRDHRAPPRDTRERDRDEDRRSGRRDDRRPRRSRSRDTPDRKIKRERSRSRERYHDRDRDRDKDRDRDRDRDRPREKDRDRAGRDRETNGHSRRDRSRSRDRKQDSKGSARSQAGTGLRSHTEGHDSSRRSRSRSPARNGAGGSMRTRSPIRRNDHDRDQGRHHDRNGDRGKAVTKQAAEPTKVTPAPPSVKPSSTPKPIQNEAGDAMVVDEGEEDARLRRLMGFVSFKSTHNTKVPGNQIYGVRKEKKTEYRQYMNRVGGFNRPLSPSRT